MDILEIDENLVRSLLSEQHPDLAVLDLRLVDGGWGNQLWRLGDDLAVRMPRTPGAPELLRREQRWLPELAPMLPLPVPTPVRVGEPSELFPHTWTVMTWVPGEPADFAPITSYDDSLARFLTALHLEAPADAPTSPDRGVSLRKLSIPEDWLTYIAPEVAAEVRDLWDDAASAPDWDGQPLWIHADLHPANVVTTDGALTGIIDFGDVCTGDPAVDLAAAWILLPDGYVTQFFTDYGTADEVTIRRARALAAVKALFLIAMGHAYETGHPGGKKLWGPAGHSALTRVLTTP